MVLKVTFILLIFLNFPAHCDYSLYSVFFTSSNTGYAVGIDWSSNTNLILKTTNGGIGWTIKSSGDSSLLYSVYFADENNGYAVGEDEITGGGIIYKTTDGGDNWTSQTSDLGNSLIAVNFPTQDIGYIAGADYFQGNVIKKTTNGGITWCNQLSGASGWLWSIYFVDSYTGFASGANGMILKTTNGGEEWEALQSGINYFLSSIYFTNLNTGFAAGENGVILKTTDAGINWQNIPSGTTSFLHSIYFTDSSNGYIVGNIGKILKTTDSGNNWDILLSGTYEDLRSVHFPNHTDGYIIGTQEIFLSTSDEGNNWNSIVMKAMQVLSPNGGENWYNGSNHIIKWNAHSIENVKIELSINNGITWSTIVTSHINNGEFFWTINLSEGSEECLVKISDAADSNVYDISDETFTIVPVSITLTSPNGGEVWLNGTTHSITWIVENLNATNLRIKLSMDNGINWNSIAPAVPNNGTYTWLVNVPATSDECLIKIETLNHIFYDESDSVFTIDILQGVDNEISDESKTSFSLIQNFPNPFNPSTKIKYTIPSVIASIAKQSQFVTLKVYDVLGNEVATLVNEEKSAGTYEVDFNATELSSGIYFYKLRVGDFSDTKKMILLR